MMDTGTLACGRERCHMFFEASSTDQQSLASTSKMYTCITGTACQTLALLVCEFSSVCNKFEIGPRPAHHCLSELAGLRCLSRGSLRPVVSDGCARVPESVMRVQNDGEDGLRPCTCVSDACAKRG
jgi:hypothetical protein